MTHTKTFRRLAGITAVAAALSIATAAPAFATVTNGTLTFNTSTPGAVTVTVTPTNDNGTINHIGFCDSYSSSDISTQGTNGHTIALVLMAGQSGYVVGANGTLLTMGSQSGGFFQLSGAGEGSFNPTTQTQNIQVTFTIPSTVPAGTYTAEVGCVSPNNWKVAAGSNFTTSNTQVTMGGSSSSGSSSSGSSGSSSSGSSGSSSTLAQTGATSIYAATASAAALLAGALLLVLRRRSAQ